MERTKSVFIGPLSRPLSELSPKGRLELRCAALTKVAPRAAKSPTCTRPLAAIRAVKVLAWTPPPISLEEISPVLLIRDDSMVRAYLSVIRSH